MTDPRPIAARILEQIAGGLTYEEAAATLTDELERYAREAVEEWRRGLGDRISRVAHERTAAGQGWGGRAVVDRERRGTRKLTDADEGWIVQQQGSTTAAKLAQQFRVSTACVYRVWARARDRDQRAKQDIPDHA